MHLDVPTMIAHPPVETMRACDLDFAVGFAMQAQQRWQVWNLIRRKIIITSHPVVVHLGADAQDGICHGNGEEGSPGCELLLATPASCGIPPPQKPTDPSRRTSRWPVLQSRSQRRSWRNVHSRGASRPLRAAESQLDGDQVMPESRGFPRPVERPGACQLMWGGDTGTCEAEKWQGDQAPDLPESMVVVQPGNRAPEECMPGPMPRWCTSGVNARCPYARRACERPRRQVLWSGPTDEMSTVSATTLNATAVAIPVVVNLSWNPFR